jgi:HK97 family phage major capsid protein
MTTTTAESDRLAELGAEIATLEGYQRPTQAQRARLAECRAEHREIRVREIEDMLRDGSAVTEPGSIQPREPQPRTAPRSEARGRALDVLARHERTAQHLTRNQLDHIAAAIGEDETDATATYVRVAGDADYAAAFHKLMRSPANGALEWTQPEREAFNRAQSWVRSMSLTDAAGGFLVPFQLDPSIVLSNTGTSNTDLRNAFTVKTCVTDVWNGVSSLGVSGEWKAEAAEVSDASPTLAPITIAPQKGDAWVPFSFELGMDAPGFAGEMAGLLADAKSRLEAAAFVLGTGTGQPKGLVTALIAAAKIGTSTTGDVYAVADVYKTNKACPARWRAGAAWLANEDIWDLTRQFATGTGPQSSFWTDFGGGTPAQLLGKPVYESSELDGTINATLDNYIAVYGDLMQYFVVDRLGTVIELVANLFGVNRRPTGERGFFMYFRTGGDMAVTDAARVLNVT